MFGRVTHDDHHLMMFRLMIIHATNEQACDRGFVLHMINPSNSQVKFAILLPVNHTILIM